MFRSSIRSVGLLRSAPSAAARRQLTTSTPRANSAKQAAKKASDNPQQEASKLKDEASKKASELKGQAKQASKDPESTAKLAGEKAGELKDEAISGAQKAMNNPEGTAKSVAEKARDIKDTVVEKTKQVVGGAAEGQAGKEAQGKAAELKQGAEQAANQAQGQAQGTANQAKQKAEEVKGGAQQQFKAVTDKLQELGGPAFQKLQTMLGPKAEPLIYNARVLGHVYKQTYIAESMAPPKSFQSVIDTYKTLWSRATSQSYWQDLLQSGAWKKVAILGVEAYGIWTIGEMIGRRSLVGYKLENHGHGHH